MIEDFVYLQAPEIHDTSDSTGGCCQKDYRKSKLNGKAVIFNEVGEWLYYMTYHILQKSLQGRYLLKVCRRR